jgi:hypothetical protein
MTTFRPGTVWKWAGIALADKDRNIAVWQIAHPQIQLHMEYRYHTDAGLWEALTTPRLKDTLITVHLTGFAEPWDRQLPGLEITDATQDPLRLDP